LPLKIFDGKKGTYNGLVLRVLFKSSYLTAYEIAKEIARIQRKPKENLRLKTVDVYSVLVRENGRLAELEKKEYIQKIEKRYRLTLPKGIATALTLFKEIEDSGIDELQIILEPLDEELEPIFREIWMIYSEIYPKKEYYRALLKATQSLIDEGLDIDVISNRKFNSYLELKLEEMLQQEISKKEITILKPETYNRIYQVFQKTMNFYREKMKEFEVAQKTVEESLLKLSKSAEQNNEKQDSSRR